MKTRAYFPAFLLVSLLLTSCYRAPEVPGFDADKWKASIENCDNYRFESYQILIDHFELIKGATQNEIQLLLGPETQHSLYLRNQKFFFYDLSCPEKGATERLRIRFDALGHVREVLWEIKSEEP
ncbi:MAG: hypothetical protein R8G66_07105 [Cytophagales bacterium]|nr:hypothetical protein [Cytophagales bacterium]